MSRIGKASRDGMAILQGLPENQYFECYGTDLRFQADTQAALHRLLPLLPHVIWKKEYNNYAKWWAYTAEWNGLNLKIYAVKEAPPTCKVITEEQEVEEIVPTTWEVVKVKKMVVVGWDCGDKGKGEQDAK